MVMGELVQECEVVVIGAGPGGYAAAFRAADLGMDVTLVDTAEGAGRRLPLSGMHSLEDVPLSLGAAL